jgi:glycosyltransferase involved in cell wall biosynthesis
MRILYLSSSYVPSRRADGLQVMRMCAALARQGHEVRLVTKHCPSREEPGVADVHDFYGVTQSFALLPLSRPVRRGGGLVFAWLLRRLLAAERGVTDLAYCRDALGAWQADRARLPFVFEAHVPPQGAPLARLHRRFLASPRCRALIVISEALAERLRTTLPLRAGLPVVVAADAADPMPAAARPLPSSALAEASELHVGYVGQLYPGKGVDLVISLAGLAPESKFHLIGGEEDALAALRGRALPSNVILHGFVPPALLPAYYQRLDVLLLPYQRRVSGATGRTDLAAWMSPMKMFEAMAAGKAILASDLPVLREVLAPEGNALLLPPDAVAAWAAALGRLEGDAELRHRLGARARADFEARYTWDARAAKVLDAIAG